LFGKSPASPIIFVSGQTPLIYDPMSIISYGYSSCTGLAILLICALRSVGIPARLVGTPAWHGNVDEGNHSWVEVYVPSPDVGHGGGEKGKEEEEEEEEEGQGGDGGEWIFLEPSPGIKEGEDAEDSNSDDLDRDPRSRWFCTPERMDGSTRVYAARYARGDRAGGSMMGTIRAHYPMAWSDTDTDDGVVGVDRTAYYTSVCGGSDSTVS
jgi:transglutaminase-like putative cysteine protease